MLFVALCAGFRSQGSVKPGPRIDSTPELFVAAQTVFVPNGLPERMALRAILDSFQIAVNGGEISR